MGPAYCGYVNGHLAILSKEREEAGLDQGIASIQRI